MKKALIAIAAAGLMASACASDGDNSEAYRQGATGAVIGGIAGAIIGNNVGSGNAGQGAAIGAVVGGVAGAARGSAQDRRNQNYDNARGVYCYPEGDCYYPDGRRYR